MEKFSFFGPFLSQVNATITKLPKKFDKWKKNYWELERIFKISLGITYWFTYIHSFKLETNDKIPDFFQHFFNILSIFFKKFFKIFSIIFLRSINFSKFFAPSQLKKQKTWKNFAPTAFCRPCAPKRVPLFTKKCSTSTFDTGFRFSRSLRKKLLF